MSDIVVPVGPLLTGTVDRLWLTATMDPVTVGGAVWTKHTLKPLRDRVVHRLGGEMPEQAGSPTTNW